MAGYYDDDEGIRAYTPLLQRFIILAAVIIAVPVAMWTITTFVRSYIAPPKAPTFQRLADAEPADSAPTPVLPPPPARAAATAPPAPAPAAQVADASPAPAEKRVALLEIKKPAAATEAAPGVAPPPPVAALAAPPAPLSAAPAPMPSPAAAAAPPAAATANAVPSAAAPTPTPPVAPSGTVAKLDSKSDSAKAANAGTGDRAIEWPNPQANTPPAISIDTATAKSAKAPAAAPPLPTMTDTASDDLPAVKPMAGPIPLPRHRPEDVAMLQPAQSAPPAAAVSGAIPLPRARPADAPVASATPDPAPTSHDAGMGTGNY